VSGYRLEAGTRTIRSLGFAVFSDFYCKYSFQPWKFALTPDGFCSFSPRIEAAKAGAVRLPYSISAEPIF
jgi:hypothetical protein